jgi:Family of unknown function (DUF6335)
MSINEDFTEDEDTGLSAEVAEEFAALQDDGDSGREQMEHEQSEYNDRSPVLSGGDVDASWADADASEEVVGGANPTPDQSVVEELGEALGITYEDNEPLRVGDKIADRDRDRWELDPASAEDFG